MIAQVDSRLSNGKQLFGLPLSMLTVDELAEVFAYSLCEYGRFHPQTNVILDALKSMVSDDDDDDVDVDDDDFFADDDEDWPESDDDTDVDDDDFDDE